MGEVKRESDDDVFTVTVAAACCCCLIAVARAVKGKWVNRERESVAGAPSIEAYPS